MKKTPKELLSSCEVEDFFETRVCKLCVVCSASSALRTGFITWGRVLISYDLPVYICTRYCCSTYMIYTSITYYLHLPNVICCIPTGIPAGISFQSPLVRRICRSLIYRFLLWRGPLKGLRVPTSKYFAPFEFFQSTIVPDDFFRSTIVPFDYFPFAQLFVVPIEC